MPAIDPNVLQCVFYVHPSPNAANAGKFGGTGFLVGTPLEDNYHLNQLYAVTNRHVIAGASGEVVLGINKADGHREYIHTQNADWFLHPDGQDVAVYPIVLSPDYQYNFIGTRLFFLTPQIVHARGIGPGDDVFMVGRFIGQDGAQGNLPTARFGHIGRMNAEPIKDGNGVEQDSFLVEMRSIPGYSGSPVFVYINPTLASPPSFMTPLGHPYNQSQHGPWLLGIDWSHLTSFSAVLNKDKRSAVEPPQWVEINSGMAGVIPAWRIQEILDLPELVMRREEVDRMISEELQDGSPAPDVATEPAAFTQSDFEQALRKVSRRVESSQSDSEKK